MAELLLYSVLKVLLWGSIMGLSGGPLRDGPSTYIETMGTQSCKGRGPIREQVAGHSRQDGKLLQGSRCREEPPYPAQQTQAERLVVQDGRKIDRFHADSTSNVSNYSWWLTASRLQAACKPRL
ncbi:hypothetical protein Hte_012561 [Hypoxylon texense]